MRRCFANLLVVACAALAPPAGAVSLFEETTYRPLTADRKAFRPGDLLTVLVFETASATASANTTTEKNGGLGFDLKSNFTTPKGATLMLSEDFSGAGRIQRSGRLAAQLTVTVRSVEDNGDLLVSGEQLIKVNDEKQEIVLSGRVRPIDIAENNTVVSSRLADARISYVGDGVLGEKQRPGILTRILSWLRII
jgi:flagellar L-ring protein precursor FlgH